ncbi:putative phage tail protein [Candidatus Vondammii sp. HM_W22]|uniref:putative phage tail protein n=1 Tax=Candidatus Vondammii sp. HM_W22 TaxID=2687299 RepID=UPI001F1396E1|nr:putative phage tail protein [Candidatus Vondammii sp. HM_W22]
MNDRAESLLNEANPRATYELLAEWEAFANLPDTCTGSTLTLQERRAVLVQRLTATGGNRSPLEDQPRRRP